MSSIGKIFIVVNLVLSLVFLGAASALISKGSDLKKQLDEKTAGMSKAEAEVKEIDAKHKATINDQQKTMDALRAEKNRFQTDAESLRVAYDQEKQVNAQLRGDVDGIKADLGNYATNNKMLHEQITAIQAEKDKIRDAKDAAVSAQEKAETEAKDAAAAMRKAQGELADIKDGAEKAMRERDEVVAKLKRMQSMTGMGADMLQGQPQIETSVQEVSDDLGMVMLNAGKNQGVQIGYSFDLYSGSTYLGKAVVDNVQETYSSAKVTIRVPGASISKGAKATTKL